MKFLNNINMKRKLIISYLIIVIIPICVIGYFLTNKLNKVSLSSTTQLSNTSMNQLQGNIINKISSYKNIIDTLLNYTPFNKYLNTYYDNEYDALNYYTQIINPLITRLSDQDRSVLIKAYTSNKTIGFSGVTNNSIETLRKEGWFNPAEASSNVVKWGKMNEKVGDKVRNYLGYYKVLRDYNANKINAVIAVFFEEEQLYSLISEDHAGGKVIFVYDNEGNIITTTERKLLNTKIDQLVFDQDNKIFDLSDNSIIKYNDRKYLFIKSQISNESLYINDWKVAYMIPADDITAGINSIWKSSILLCLVCVSFSLVVIFFVSESITSRTSNLINKIQKVWKGNFKVAVDISGSDEIGKLEKDFNSMVAKIDTLINEVYEANIKIMNAQIYNQKVEMGKKEAELIALQGQINPHYLFNTLETVRMNLILKEDRETANIIKVFAESFRQCIDGKNDVLTLKQEMKFIENYFTIQKYRHGDKINFEISIPENLLEYSVPKLIIQPLVENAVYHGIEMKTGSGMIKIEAYEENNDLIIRVSDDGVGIDEEDLQKIKDAINNNLSYEKQRNGTGIALRNVHNRLRLLYGEMYGLKIFSLKNVGTITEINIPAVKLSCVFN